MDGLQIYQVRSLKELDTIENLWRDLESRDEGLSVFQSWDWNRAWCEYVLRHGKDQLAVRVIEDSAGRQVAILPFYELQLAGPLLRVTQFLGHRMSFHNDILLDDQENKSLIESVIKLMLNDLDPYTFLHLRHMAGQSALTKAFQSTGRVKEQCDRVYVRADKSIKEQYKRLGRSASKTYRWSRNQLQKKFNSEYVCFSGPLFEKAFDEMMSLHNKRFDSMGKSTLLTGDNLIFLKQATNELSKQNRSEILQLRGTDGVVIAAMLLVIDKRRCFFIQCGFDPEFSRYSPLRVLIAEAMRHVFDDLGCEIFDFGPGYERYKYDWSSEIGKNYFCSLGGTGIYSKVAAKAYQLAFERQMSKSNI